MIDQEARRLIEQYGTSYFANRDRVGDDRICAGSKVPIQRGDDLTRAMLDNVEQSKRDVSGTRQRAQEAAQDGLFDTDAIGTVRDKKLRERAFQVARDIIGDYRRARAELDHWREYASWSMGDGVVTLRNSEGAGGLVRGLAESKSGALPSPATVPITDEELNEGRRRIEAQLEDWRIRHPPAAREPGSDDEEARP
jgi:hypothetical protein